MAPRAPGHCQCMAGVGKIPRERAFSPGCRAGNAIKGAEINLSEQIARSPGGTHDTGAEHSLFSLRLQLLCAPIVMVCAAPSASSSRW
jgi:hypothetical protein